MTLHNQALMNMEENPTHGFEKLQFLLQQVPCPPETFSNLLLLYLKHEVQLVWNVQIFFFFNLMELLSVFVSAIPQYYDLAADVLAENTHLTYKCLSPYLYDFIDANITQQTSPEEVCVHACTSYKWYTSTVCQFLSIQLDSRVVITCNWDKL